MKGFIKYLFNCLLEIIYCGNEKCIICGKEKYNNKYVCPICNSKIRKCDKFKTLRVINNLITVYSSLYYSSAVRRLIIKLKYENGFKSGKVLSKYMVDLIRRENIECDIITYVPLSKKRIKDRGYNQGKYLANEISMDLGKKVDKLLYKKFETKDQIGLSSKERWKNLKGCFKYDKNKNVEGKTILLVDDVITTGATVYYCCLELLKNRAKKVVVVTATSAKK